MASSPTSMSISSLLKTEQKSGLRLFRENFPGAYQYGYRYQSGYVFFYHHYKCHPTQYGGYDTRLVVEWFQDTRSTRRENPEKCHPRTPVTRGHHYFYIIARRDKSVTASQLYLKLYAATGNRVSKVTVSRRLYERG
ncbi:hypothetical protein TNCV_4460651 [Trichonephila clavipes]|nr:hypothetical protein TNCV_4460651 [Trichonephila clavipes]